MAKEKMIKAKLINLESRGKSISASVNGQTYIFPDNYEGDVPESVIHALNDAVETRYIFEDINIDKGEKAESFQNERFKVILLDVAEANKAAKADADAKLAAENETLKAEKAAKEEEQAKLAAENEELKAKFALASKDPVQ